MAEILEVPTEPVITAQTEPPPTEPTGWMTPDGEVREGAPDNVKNLLEAKKWTNLAQMVDGYFELERFAGVPESERANRHLVIPTSPEDEAWNDIWNQCGRPKTSEGYEVPDDPEVQLDADLVNRWKEASFKDGKTQRQFASDFVLYCDMIKGAEAAQIANREAQQEANTQALQQKYGDDYIAQITGARVIADKLGIYKTLEAKDLISDPEIIDMLVTINSRTDEDAITPSTPAVPQKSALQERDEIMANPAFKDKFAPNRKELMQRYMALNQIIANSGQGIQQPSR